MLKFLGKIVKERTIVILAFVVLLILYAVLYKIYIPRVNAFGCFDDCNNFMRGYFFLHGSPLFSGVFSGHQPLGSYLSALVQFVTQPININELVLKHRQFVFLFSLVSNIVLILRFGPKMIFFTIIFEFSKFYIFGDRFLGEAMVVYPSIYLAGIALKRILKEKLYKFDYYLAAIFCWFIIFIRAPFGPMALVSYAFLLFDWPLKRIKKEKLVSLSLFTILSIIMIFVHDIGEYFYNVIYFNVQVNLAAETKLEMVGPRIFHWFFYPIYIFFYGPDNIFRYLLISINLVFLGLLSHLLLKGRYVAAFFIFVTLGLSNIRPVIPGDLFYGSFHMVIWYGLFIFFTVFLLTRKRLATKYVFAGLAILSISFFFFISSPEYFAKEKVDTHEEFITNYGYLISRGEAIKALSDSNDSLFLDASDDMIYWQSGLFSKYEFSWYTSAMPHFERYRSKRIEMFENYPPEFYREYGMCPKDESPGDGYSLPEFIKDDYTRLFYNGEESCIFVHNDKLGEITEEQWKKANEFGFTLEQD